MPPKQCPECGRFLRKDLIESLATGTKPCPRCEAPLQADMFDVVDASPPTTAAVAAPPPPAAASDSPPATPEPPVVSEPVRGNVDTESVRPADLPSPVAGSKNDPLAGWDQDGYSPRTADVLAAEDNTPVMAAGGAAAGVLVGLVSLGRSRGRGALLGGLVGAITGVVVGRMTRPTE